jgi:hypothetical protein
MTIALTSTASIRGALTTAGDGGTTELPINEALTKTVAHGTGIDQATHIYIDDFSISASGTLDIDLSGSLEDRHGNAAVFTAIKEILLIADATNTNDVVYGNGTNPFVGPLSAGTATVTVKPGNRFNVTNYSAAGWSLTAGSSDVIKLANSSSGSAVTGTIVIIGEA